MTDGHIYKDTDCLKLAEINEVMDPSSILRINDAPNSPYCNMSIDNSHKVTDKQRRRIEVARIPDDEIQKKSDDQETAFNGCKEYDKNVNKPGESQNNDDQQDPTKVIPPSQRCRNCENGFQSPSCPSSEPKKRGHTQYTDRRSFITVFIIVVVAIVITFLLSIAISFALLKIEISQIREDLRLAQLINKESTSKRNKTIPDLRNVDIMVLNDISSIKSQIGELRDDWIKMKTEVNEDIRENFTRMDDKILDLRNAGVTLFKNITDMTSHMISETLSKAKHASDSISQENFSRIDENMKDMKNTDVEIFNNITEMESQIYKRIDKLSTAQNEKEAYLHENLTMMDDKIKDLRHVDTIFMTNITKLQSQISILKDEWFNATEESDSKIQGNISTINDQMLNLTKDCNTFFKKFNDLKSYLDSYQDEWNATKIGGSFLSLRRNLTRVDEKVKNVQSEANALDKELVNLTNMLRDDKSEIIQMKKAMAIKTFSFEGTTLYRTLYMSSDNLTISTHNITGGFRGTDNGFKNYKGVRGSTEFTNFDIVYFEVLVDFEVINDAQTRHLLFEIGFSSMNSTDRQLYLGHDDNTWSVYGVVDSIWYSIDLEYQQNGKTGTFIKILTHYALNATYHGLYGFYLNGPEKTINVIDKHLDKIVCKFTDVDFKEHIYPVFGVYNSKRFNVTLSLTTGKDIADIPNKVFDTI